MEDVYRSESRHVLATLIRLLKDFDLAEEALHEAFTAAVEQWPREGVPAIDDVYTLAGIATLPRELELPLESETTLRGQLGKSIGFLNRFSGGAFFVAAAAGAERAGPERGAGRSAGGRSARGRVPPGAG